MDGFGLGLGASFLLFSHYLVVVARDSAVVVGSFVAMALGVALFRKFLFWFARWVGGDEYVVGNGHSVQENWESIFGSDSW